MLHLAFEIILLIALSSLLGALSGYFVRKLFYRSNAHERAIIAAAKSQPFQDKK
ncbi:hypothetical protein [Bartonella sp. HY038]|uniref:hypothetical protein n=1 Tax=Bartonella sp. HY038 TaxID=2759660 RepID=UPI0015F7B47A|nr:hypothetical protein [Bartonella sp. HY038]